MGWILLRGSDVALLDLDAFHDLEFEFVDELKNTTQTITIKNLMLTREPQCLTPGNDASDPNASFILEVADKRWALANPHYHQTVNLAFNVRNMASNTFMNGGYTWATMLQEIWEEMPLLGTWPGLPYSPAGTPTNWQFRGISALDALCSVLDHLSFSLQFKLDGTYDIVEDAGDDLIQTVLEATYAKREIYNARFLAVTAPRVPETIRVLFHRHYAHGGSEDTISVTGNWQMASNLAVDIATGETSNGIIHEIWSDQLAYTLPDDTLDTGVAAILTAVANELADTYLDTALQPRKAKRYSGLIDFETGPQAKAVTWKCGLQNGTDAGVFTEIVWHPFSDYDPAEGRFISSQNQPPDFTPTWPISSALPNVVAVEGEIPLGTIVDGDHQIWDQENETWITKSPAKFLGMPSEKYMGRLVGNVSGVPLFAGQGNSWGNIYVTNIYDVTNIYVENVYVENIYVEYIEVNILNVTIINIYGCTDLVNAGVNFPFIGKITCEPDADGRYLLYQHAYGYKQTYDFTGCPITTISYIGKTPFGCCSLDCLGEPPPDPPPDPPGWDYCCPEYPNDLCGAFTKLTVLGDSCACGNSKFIVKIDHPGITATYWGGTWESGSTWEVLRVDGNDYLGFCGPNSCCWATAEGAPNIIIGGPEDGSVVAMLVDGVSDPFILEDCQNTQTIAGLFSPDGPDGTIYVVRYIISPSGGDLPSGGDPSSEVTRICLTLVDGCWVGSVILGSVVYAVTICCVGTADNPFQYEMTMESEEDTFTFQTISVVCGEVDMVLDFGTINVAGTNYTFSVFVDATGVCCEEDSSVVDPPPNDCSTAYDYGSGLTYDIPFGPSSDFWVTVDPGTVTQAIVQKIGGTCLEPAGDSCLTWTCEGYGGCVTGNFFNHLDSNSFTHTFSSTTGPFKIRITSDADVSGTCRLTFS